MPRRINTNPFRSPSHTIACIGDSLTQNESLGVRADQFWPTQLEGLLQAAGCHVKVRNFGRSGNTSGPFSGAVANADILSRFPAMTTFETPDIACVFIGVNDVGNGITGQSLNTTVASVSSQTVFTLQAGQGANVHAAQAITIGSGSTAQYGIVSSVATDTVTLTAPLANRPVVNQAVTQGTQANITQAVQRLLNAGVTRIVVLNTQYQQYNVGGDTVSSPSANYATLRPFQAAAVTSFSGSSQGTVVLCDLYAFMRALIGSTFVYGGVTYTFADHADSSPSYLATLSGTINTVTDTTHIQVTGNVWNVGQGITVVTSPGTTAVTTTISAVSVSGANTALTLTGAVSGMAPGQKVQTSQSWHVIEANQHLNPLGNAVVAAAVQATIAAQTGWLSALQS